MTDWIKIHNHKSKQRKESIDMFIRGLFLGLFLLTIYIGVVR